MAINVGQIYSTGAKNKFLCSPVTLLKKDKEGHYIGEFSDGKSITKIGIQGNTDNIVDLNDIAFYLGKTGILDIEGWKITSFYPPYTESTEGKEINPDFLIDVSWEE